MKQQIEGLELPVKFQELKTNVDKIRFSYTLLKEKGLLSNHVFSEKSNEMSLEARNLGNVFFKEKNYVEALKYYNKSLCFAPLASENLAIAYANRSAVYLNTGFYSYCLINLELALSGNYPKQMVVKLEQRKKECLKKMERSTDSYKTFINEKPEIKVSYKTKSKVKSMIEGLELGTSIKYGRHMIAKQNLFPGDIIIVEQPFVKSLTNVDVIGESEYSRCINCLKSNFLNVFPCKCCTKTMFCSDTCQEEAFEDYHEFEGPIIGADIDYLMLRAALMSITVFKGDMNEIIKFANTSINIFEDEYDPSRKEDQLKVLRSHASHAPVLNLDEEFKISNSCAIIWHLLEFCNFKELLGSAEFDDLFLSLLYDFGVVSQFYSHSLLTMAKTPEENQKLDGKFSPQKFGTGLLPISSIINHSCAPNVTRMGNGNTVVIVVRRHIKKGDQIFDSYGPHHLNQKLYERQNQIKKKYCFECTCEACTNDYQLLDDLKMEDIVEFFPLCAGIMKILEYDKTWAQKAYPQSKKFLQKFGEKYPAYEICAAQIIMIHCIAILMIKTPMELQLINSDK